MKNSNAKNGRFVAVLLTATFLMASSFIAGKTLLSAGFPPFTLVGCRFLVAALATLPILGFEKENTFMRAVFPVHAEFKHIRHVFIIGLLQTTGVIGLIFWAMKSISANVASILLYTNPLWVALLGGIWLKEKLATNQIIGLLIGIIGVVLAIGIQATGTREFSLPGVVMALFSALCWSFATVVNKQTTIPFSQWTLTFWQMLIGAVLLLIIGWISGEQLTGKMSAGNIGWFIWLAIPGSTIALGLWFKALSISGATKASGYLFLCPAFTILISFLVFHINVSGSQLIGGALIAVSLLLISKEVKPAAAV
jgi:drug/metabolite transporter (DMT)-like permease